MEFNNIRLIMDTKTNTITATSGTEPYATTIVAGKHIFLSDEPVDHGGADKGPKPHDLLISALASCTCITVSMYAFRKGWKLEGVNADVSMDRITENGLQTTSTQIKMTFLGALDPEQIERLLNIAGKCPVHKTLAPAMTIEISLKG